MLGWRVRVRGRVEDLALRGALVTAELLGGAAVHRVVRQVRVALARRGVEALAVRAQDDADDLAHFR